MATVSVEDMKQRVSKIFQNKHAVNRPANLPNIPGIFQKKWVAYQVGCFSYFEAYIKDSSGIKADIYAVNKCSLQILPM